MNTSTSKFVDKLQSKYSGSIKLLEWSVENSKHDTSKFVCYKHGEFTNYRSAVFEWGCLLCNRESREDKWKARFGSKWGDKLKYIMNGEVGSNTGIIHCQIHGDFLSPSLNRVLLVGCPRCNEYTKYDTESFIEECKKIHGDEYDYSDVHYSSMREKVNIRCRKHGIFEQTPRAHLLQGCGCLKCYKSRKNSKAETQFLDYLNITNRNVNIGKYVVDGLSGNTVYEFLGILWHGKPTFWDKFTRNKFRPKGLMPQQLFQETNKKMRELTSSNFIVKYCWEDDWNQYVKGNINSPVIYEYDGMLKPTPISYEHN